MTEHTRVIDGMRGVRYGEILPVFLRDGELVAEVYGTQLLNDCPQELWDAIDPAAVAAGTGAAVVRMNGPRYWVLDGFGTKVATSEPVLRDFGGITFRRIATVVLGGKAAPAAGPYTVRNVDRGAVFFWDAGKPVYELVDPEGRAWVMQALCVAVDPSMCEDSLASLGERLEMPEGWSYRTRILEEELVIDTSRTLASVLQDEFENTYTLPM